MDKPTLQKILRQHHQGVLKRLKLPFYQRRALNQLGVCRTEILGGHKQMCEDGHINGIWYNSCMNRSCPQCRGIASEEWLRNTQSALLDCTHHHITFTFAEELNVLWRFNREIFSGILFKAVHETLKTFSDDPRHMGAQAGIMLTLHTWGRDLVLHPHIHALVSHGGLNNKEEWIEPKRQRLFPQKAVMQVFRGKLLSKLRAALNTETFVLPPDMSKIQASNLFNKVGRKDWTVHFCKPYKHANGVAKYLARYVKGGPFNNRQFVAVEDDKITFKYKSHKTKQLEKKSLSVKDFILRYVQHVPLPNKPSIRYYGLYSSSVRRKLNKARELMGQKPVSARERLDWQSYLEGQDSMPVCRECGKPLLHDEEVTYKKFAA